MLKKRANLDISHQQRYIFCLLLKNVTILYQYHQLELLKCILTKHLTSL